jgi:uncharacterized protein (DUF1015 family)
VREFSIPRLDHLDHRQRLDLAARNPASVLSLSEGAPGLIERLLETRGLLRHASETIYVHRHVHAGRASTAVIALMDGSAFGSGVVRAHRRADHARVERARGEAARLGVQTDSVIVGFETDQRIAELMEREMNDRPLFHVVADDGATHTLWAGARAHEVVDAFARVPRAMVLEGHHRALVHDVHALVALVPLHEARAHMSATLLPPATVRAVEAWCRAAGERVAGPVEPVAGVAAACVVDAEGGASAWHQVRVPDSIEARIALVADAITHDAPVVWRPGPGGADEVERLLHAAGGGAVVLWPDPPMRSLLDGAHGGRLLPQGSTWFEPRLRSGLWMAETGLGATTIAR